MDVQPEENSDDLLFLRSVDDLRRLVGLPKKNDDDSADGATLIFGAQPKLVVPHQQRKLASKEIRNRLLEMIRENMHSTSEVDEDSEEGYPQPM